MNNIIDEIKKEIEDIADFYDEDDPGSVELPKIMSLLDKYQTQIQVISDQEDVYKKCWEELKIHINQFTNQKYFNCNISKDYLEEMQKLEQKHNIKEVE